MKPDIDIQELVQSIRIISQERSLDEPTVISSIEEALAMVLKRHRRAGEERDYRVSLDTDKAVIYAFRRWRVLDEEEIMEDPVHEIMLDLAQEKDAGLKPGDYWEEVVSQDEVASRLNAQMARQLIQQKLKDVEKSRLLEEFLQRGDDLVHATVRKVDQTSGDAICEASSVECFLRKEDQVPRESLRAGDRIRAVIKEVNREGRIPRLYITRANVDFLKKLFEREVPEIENGVLQIVNAVREPGHRAKVAVRSHDLKVDPVGTCVGIRGSRVQAVMNEISGERVDIIQWHEEPTDYVIKAISPAEIQEIDMHEEEMILIVAEENISSTIGRNGSNIRLASELTGWRLRVLTGDKRDTERQDEMEKVTAMFMERLDIDRNVAEILFHEGFSSIEVVALCSTSEMSEIDGFNDDLIKELQERARQVMEQDEDRINGLIEKADPRLKTLDDMDEGLLRLLAKAEILTLQDLADLATDELEEISGIHDPERLERIIMDARAPILEH